LKNKINYSFENLKMFSFKKLIKKFFKFNKKQNKEWNNNWDDFYQENNWSSYSITNKKDFFESFLSVVEEENQYFKEIELREFKIFIDYQQFREYLINEKIINFFLRDYNNIKSHRIQHILGAIEAHMKSYFYLFKDPYFNINNTSDLKDERAIGYEWNFDSWFYKINLECEKYNIKYLWSYENLKR
jgi:hypothetical protein